MMYHSITADRAERKMNMKLELIKLEELYINELTKIMEMQECILARKKAGLTDMMTAVF